MFHGIMKDVVYLCWAGSRPLILCPCTTLAPSNITIAADAQCNRHEWHCKHWNLLTWTLSNNIGHFKQHDWLVPKIARHQPAQHTPWLIRQTFNRQSNSFHIRDIPYEIGQGKTSHFFLILIFITFKLDVRNIVYTKFQCPKPSGFCDIRHRIYRIFLKVTNSCIHNSKTVCRKKFEQSAF